MLNSQLQQQGFVIRKADNELREHLLASYRSELMAFCDSWNDLPKDSYLLDGGNYRYRRYSVFGYQNKKLTILPYEPHYQTLDYNNLHGGINRHLEAWQQTSIDNPVLLEMIAWVMQQINSDAEQKWRIQSHQFRIVASAESTGKPTPEGVHKDGADYIFIMLMQRHNIEGGISGLYDNDRNLIEQGALENLGDLALLNDKAVYHGVSEISVVDKSKNGHRDVLVLTFHQDTKE